MAAFLATSFVARMKIVSYNMNGFNQGKSLLTDLFDRYDAIFCQEHWLSSDFLFKISAVDKEFLCFSESGMIDTIVSRVLTGRPFGGLSILVANTLAAKAKLVSMNTHFIAISLKNMLFVNMYLPTCDSSEEYKSKLLDILCAVGECIDKHPGFSIFLGGDFNFVFNETRNVNFNTVFIIYDVLHTIRKQKKVKLPGPMV